MGSMVVAKADGLQLQSQAYFAPTSMCQALMPLLV